MVIEKSEIFLHVSRGSTNIAHVTEFAKFLDKGRAPLDWKFFYIFSTIFIYGIFYLFLAKGFSGLEMF